MQPNELSWHLRTIASAIDSASSPDRLRVASAIAGLLFATDRTLALTFRDALHQEVVSLLPAEFGPELHDTNLGGKGFHVGYVSFGVDPNSWESAGIIGGILVKATYSPDQFRSEAPDPVIPGFSHSKGGGSITMDVTANYYNKRPGGSGAEHAESGGPGVIDLGQVLVDVDAQEHIVNTLVVDPQKMRSGIKHIIDDILAKPPAAAQSAKRKRSLIAPTGSPQGLLNWLIQQKRSDVGRSEIDALARALSTRTGKALGNAISDIETFFRKGGWAINPKT